MASKFRETAESCFRMARTASTEDDKSLWMKMAQFWLLKAHDAEGERPSFEAANAADFRAPETGQPSRPTSRAKA